MSYKIVQGESLKIVETEIRELMEKGWVPLGGISHSITYDPSVELSVLEESFAQALVLPEIYKIEVSEAKYTAASGGTNKFLQR